MLIKRNLLMFFRDRANVFFSLLSVLLVVALYVLFLGTLMEQGLRAQLGFDSDKIGAVMSGIMLGGTVAITSFTSCLGAAGVSIKDKEDRTGAEKDFLSSPVSRGKIVSGYVLSSAVVSLIMTSAALLACMVYLISRGSDVPSFFNILRLALTTVLSVLCANAIVFFIAIFLKSPNAFSALSASVGALIGFLMGVYIPIGQLPEAVQWVIRLFPMSHGASMYRQVMADDMLAGLFEHAPPGTLSEFRYVFGIVFSYGDFTSGFWFSAMVLLVTSVVFYGLSLVVMKRKRRG